MARSEGLLARPKRLHTISGLGVWQCRRIFTVRAALLIAWIEILAK
jgi:hypothetical protein